ncbi:MAG: hypothetical protein LBR16_08960 [Treponema sp.]|jgi:hypothetical protein|nr:hypothetical protein [Treponema sp.]
MRQRRRPRALLAAAVLGALFAPVSMACRSMGSYVQADHFAEAGRYDEAAVTLDEQKALLYHQSTDVILYELDQGLLAHYGGRYRESIELLASGEEHIEEAYTQSAARLTASAIVNDNSKNYDGEDYEDLYINVFNALNYYHEGNVDDAIVEIRHMNEKLNYLETKYSVVKRKMANINEYDAPSSAEWYISKFANSALSRYLGVLFYRAGGRGDDARIDYEGLAAAYRNAPELYRFPIPSSLKDDMTIPKEKARLNVLAFSGLAPVKRERVTWVPLGSDMNPMKIALPEMVSRHSFIDAIDLVLEDGTTVNLELLEDIDAVARETFRSKVGAITRKTVLRSILKNTAAVATRDVGGAMSQSSNDRTAAAGSLMMALGVLGQIAANASEQADLRMGRYFPGKAFVGGLTLEPGTYSFTVRFLGGGRVLHAVEYHDVEVSAGGLNLVEAVCLR